MGKHFNVIARQCFEYGFPQAFRSLSDHSKRLIEAKAANRKPPEMENHQTFFEESNFFEMRVIAFGWLAGLLTFIGELWFGRRFG